MLLAFTMAYGTSVLRLNDCSMAFTIAAMSSPWRFVASIWRHEPYQYSTITMGTGPSIFNTESTVHENNTQKHAPPWRFGTIECVLQYSTKQSFFATALRNNGMSRNNALTMAFKNSSRGTLPSTSDTRQLKSKYTFGLHHGGSLTGTHPFNTYFAMINMVRSRST